jgi:hypothetical protein
LSHTTSNPHVLAIFLNFNVKEMLVSKLLILCDISACHNCTSVIAVKQQNKTSFCMVTACFIAICTGNLNCVTPFTKLYQLRIFWSILVTRYNYIRSLPSSMFTTTSLLIYNRIYILYNISSVSCCRFYFRSNI